MSNFIISLDFEMFWGVNDTKNIEGYGKNILGEWTAIPKTLRLFERYGIHATWATVGMLLCKDYKQWLDMMPEPMPRYTRNALSAYSCIDIARTHQKLFFGRPLVENILATKGQELASHTYSHFYAKESGVSIDDFVIDMNLNNVIFKELGVRPRSFVFPRNQVREDYLKVISEFGFSHYRGNQSHFIYANGSDGKKNIFFRGLRLLDGYLPITGAQAFKTERNSCELTNVPASSFFRPKSKCPFLTQLHLNRIKSGMTYAAVNKLSFHLWWHPHNFGIDTQTCLESLQKVIEHYLYLKERFGMRSITMSEYRF